MSKEKTMKISEVKGRPMLHWIGKQPLNVVKAFPAQLAETFNIDKASKNPTYENLKDKWTNLLFHGDNKEILSTLLVNGFRGKIDLIYIDPPFDSGADYVRKVELRGTKTKLEGEEQSLIEQVQYTDIWANDNYLQFMYERLILLRELLSEQGSIYLHCDWHKNHHLRFLLDEVFGVDNFVNEIIWYYSNKFKFEFSTSFGGDTETIFIYAKSKGKHILNHIKVPVKNKRKQNKVTWDAKQKKMVTVKDENGKVVYYDSDEKIVGTLWDIPRLNSMATVITGYPTQKPDDLLERIIKASTNEDSFVLDCFMGSGTTQAVAQKLGRRWIGCDINKGAIQTTSKRLQNVIKEQAKEFKFDNKYNSFAYYKINDYDLQIQHNEFKELIVSHLGMKKVKTDNFFDGILGDKLVKIISFNHPLTMLDLQLVKDEIAKRKNEERNIVLVSFGIELKVIEELEQYNKTHPINRIEFIELKTDKKYGSFFIHKPAQADVEIKRNDKNAKIEIKEFISPSILNRLNIDMGLFRTKIDDFRSQIDVVLIDTNYKGDVFNICISDVPEKKKDFVKGIYEFELTNKNNKIAIKIIDMLGEEILVVD